MPTLNKRSKFRGVAKQFLGDINVPVSVSNDAATDTVASSSKRISTASEKKLSAELGIISVQEDNLLDSSQKSVGYRIVDLQCLSDAMSRLHMCEEGKLLFTSRLLVV